MKIKKAFIVLVSVSVILFFGACGSKAQCKNTSKHKYKKKMNDIKSNPNFHM